MEQAKVTMAKIRSGKTIDARTDPAEYLSSLVRNLSNKQVTETRVTETTSLLDSPDDSVRYQAATALGNMGPAAKSAFPKLEKMLPAADSANGTITSASGIRYAPLKMGVEPPLPSKCSQIAG
jgi:hypothetical protein